jgi:sugar lactone lactonase YvrE
MNYKILLSTSFIALGLSAAAQNAATYAITGDGNADFNWMNIRKIDAGTGKLVNTIFDRRNPKSILVDADTKKAVVISGVYNGQPYTTTEYPTATLVAAAAYDKKNNKLFFTPMRKGELRWLDLNDKSEKPTYYTLTSTLLNPLNLADEANHITRMDIAADGNGYAITNDGNHLIRFTTGKKTVITDLGNLIDADKNTNGMSIHNRCTSWGGDMVADAYGKLYVISASHQVFKVDVDTKIATHLGTITGLPATYTTNGAAVDDDGNIIVSCATSTEGFYKFSIKDMAAVKVEGSDKVYNASDLANGNLLFQKEADAQRNYGGMPLAPAAPVYGDARIFPNPVTANQFRVLFDGQKAGRYLVAVTDLSGRAIMNSMVTITSKVQSETVLLNAGIAKGMYLVKVTDAANQLVFTERILVQ